MASTTVLFSYGSLQIPAVQRSTFGRLLDGLPDRLPGFTLSELLITDPAVVAVSGSDRHPAVRPTGDPGDEVAGTAFTVTWTELAAADEYEVPPYARLWVGLGSGRHAWVYVDQPHAPASLGGEPGADLPEFDEPPSDPLALLRQWLAVAVRRRVSEPGAFVLATAGADGRPSGRVVLLKEVDDRGLVFTSDSTSRKGRDLAANPWATAVFHWRETVQQIVVTGPVHTTTPDESDALFAERPVRAQITAALSAQSRPLDDEAALRRRAAAHSTPPARPDGWTGYVLAPQRIEFWHGRTDRLHRRLEYARAGNGWRTCRLQP
jgi:dihydrophenazinedicarboxylate synthase